MADVDTYGPNAALTFFRVQRVDNNSRRHTPRAGSNTFIVSESLSTAPPAYLSQKLDRPLPTKDGGTLRTVAEARAYMLGLSKSRELRSQWQH